MLGQKYLVLDYETRSEVDLKAVGAHEYSVHPSTEILCAAWAYGTKEELKTAKVCSWSDFTYDDHLQNVFYNTCLTVALKDPSILIVAHNAFFEQVITKNVFGVDVPPSRWICTAARAAALALPRNLEGACAALNLAVQKDMEGRKLMLKYCKPRRATLKDKSKWHSNPKELRRLVQYCETDIKAETLLFFATPSLNETEQKVWNLDQRMNLNGVRVDQELVAASQIMIDEETKALAEETIQITGGHLKSTNQIGVLLNYLNQGGKIIGDLTAKSVKDVLATDKIDGLSRRLLEIRRDTSRTSTAKYQAFEQRSRSDGRVRDHLLYHGASTGRWSGQGVQVHNFPRGTIKDTNQSAKVCTHSDLETVRLLYGNPMEVFSSNLRACIIPTEGFKFYCGDYAAIEARVLFWLAEHDDGLKAYEENRDLYREMASRIFHVPLKEVTSPQREVAKRAVLGCGYGMGATKFGETCATFGTPVSAVLAKTAVETYRETHHPVPKLWSTYQTAAIAATRNPGKIYKVNKTAWFVKANFLWCTLPSGRRLAFYKPEVRFKATPWGEKREALYHWSQNSLTRKWECAHTYGGKLVENVTQAVARDIMAAAMLRLDNLGYTILLSVHDELLVESTKGSLDQFQTLMETKEPWFDECPIKVEAWQGDRYKK